MTINLPPELESAVRQQAERIGQDVGAFVLQAVQEKIARARGFDEICAPFAQAVEASGISDEEVGRFFEVARGDAWREEHANRRIQLKELSGRVEMEENWRALENAERSPNRADLGP